MNHFNIPGLGVIPPGQAFELKGVKYPANWLKSADAGWLQEHSVTAVAPTAPTPPEINLAQYVGDKRRLLTSGSILIDLGGGKVLPIWVDPESRLSILGLFVEASVDSTTQTMWKGADGAFYHLNATEITTAGRAVRSFIGQCFVIEAGLLAAVSNGVVTTTQQIDEAEWPLTE